MPPNLTFTFGDPRANETQPPLTSEAFRVAILGDFRGQTRPEPGGGGPDRVRQLDIDTFEKVLQEWAPSVRLDLDRERDLTVDVTIQAMDDFHPDALFESNPAFAPLRNLKTKLKNPATFAEAAAQLGLAPARKDTPTCASRSSDDTVTEAEASGAQTLDDLLDRPARPAATSDPRLRGSGLVDKLIRTAVEPHVVPSRDPRLDECLSRVDAMIARLMRMILHHPAFQELEGLWRGAEMLVRRLPSDEVRIHLVDVTGDDLGAALGVAPEQHAWLEECLGGGEHRVAGELPWKLVAGAFTVGHEPEQVEKLEALARLGTRLGAAVVSAAGPNAVGAATTAKLTDPKSWTDLPPEQAEAWNRLRQSPAAKTLAVAMPRFLGRLPYGKRGEPVTTFDFEELDSPEAHDHYLWCNPAFLATITMTEKALEAPGEPTGASGMVDDIPFFTYETDGRTETLSPAEVWLPDRAVERLLDLGISPVQAIRGYNAVRIVVRAFGP